MFFLGDATDDWSVEVLAGKSRCSRWSRRFRHGSCAGDHVTCKGFGRTSARWYFPSLGFVRRGLRLGKVRYSYDPVHVFLGGGRESCMDGWMEGMSDPKNSSATILLRATNMMARGLIRPASSLRRGLVPARRATRGRMRPADRETSTPRWRSWPRIARRDRQGREVGFVEIEGEEAWEQMLGNMHDGKSDPWYVHVSAVQRTLFALEGHCFPTE